MRTSHAVPNRILCADAYTVSSFETISPEMRERSAYHVVFRHFESPPGLEGFGEGKLIFHGLTGILRKLFERPLARTEIEEAHEFLATFHAGGLPYPADWAMWERVAEMGCFPLQIYARRDGSPVNPGEPVMQILSAPGFGELAAHFESKLMQVWAPSARATLLRRWLEYNEGLVLRTTDLTDPGAVRRLAQMQLSDFGDRASSCAEESEVLGLAHLTSHASTDTLSAAFDAWRASGKRFQPSSIRALAHRVVQGHVSEAQAFESLYQRTRTGKIGSYVADCYDFERAVTQHLLPLAGKAAQDGLIVVARPDSGDALRSLRFILDSACETGLYRINGRGLIEMTSLRYIYADALSFENIRHHINEPLVQSGFSVPMCGVYGMGGFLRNSISRDRMGAAMKLCAVGPQLRPVAKLSKGIKASIPGLVRVDRREDGGPTVHPTSPAEADYGELRLMYDRGRFTDDFEEGTDFTNVRRRVLEDWSRFVPSVSVLGEGVRRRITELEARYLPGKRA